MPRGTVPKGRGWQLTGNEITRKTKELMAGHRHVILDAILDANRRREQEDSICHRGFLKHYLFLQVV